MIGWDKDKSKVSHLKCSICSIELSSKEGMKIHVESIHGVKVKLSALDWNKTDALDIIKSHFNSIPKKSSQSTKVQPIDDATNKSNVFPFTQKCSYCGKNYNSKVFMEN